MKKSSLFLLLLGGLLWAWCYPPLPLGFMAFVALVPIFMGSAGLSPKQAFWGNFLSGLLHNAFMYWWIYHVIQVGPGLAIGAGLVALNLYLSLFNGLMGWTFRLCLKSPWRLALFPGMWAGLEVFRAYGQMSFPWSDLGYTLGPHLAFIQSVRLWGVYGLSVWIVTVNLLFYLAWKTRTPKRWGFLAFGCLIPMALGLEGKIHLRNPTVTTPNLDIALVQPAIPQTKKWDEGYFLEVMQKTWNTLDGGDTLTGARGAQLIVLPETAVPDFLRSRREIVEGFQDRADHLGHPILLGALDFVADKKPWREYIFYNSAFLFRPGKAAPQQYSKLRLVPFSEKLPFDNFIPLINYVNLGEGDFSEGKEQVIWGDSLAYSPSICYEVIYPSFARQARNKGAKILINITNDGWFGRSSGPYQHANIARFRAVEVGVPVARCANTGISVFYDYRGQIIGQTKLMSTTVLRRKLPLYQEATPYLKYGALWEGFWLALWVITFVFFLYEAWKTRLQPPRPVV